MRHRMGRKTGFLTVPNYLDVYNKVAIVQYEANMFSIRESNNMPHPYWLASSELYGHI
jgi:hypothetical protein